MLTFKGVAFADPGNQLLQLCRVPKLVRLSGAKSALMDRVIETDGKDNETGVHLAKVSETGVPVAGWLCRSK